MLLFLIWIATVWDFPDTSSLQFWRNAKNNDSFVFLFLMTSKLRGKWTHLIFKSGCDTFHMKLLTFLLMAISPYLWRWLLFVAMSNSNSRSFRHKSEPKQNIWHTRLRWKVSKLKMLHYSHGISILFKYLT